MQIETEFSDSAKKGIFSVTVTTRKLWKMAQNWVALSFFLIDKAWKV